MLKTGTRCLSLRLQVLVLPMEAGGTGPGDEPDPAFRVLHFPMLRGVVEFEVAGTVNFKLAKLM